MMSALLASCGFSLERGRIVIIQDALEYVDLHLSDFLIELS